MGILLGLYEIDRLLALSQSVALIFSSRWLTLYFHFSVLIVLLIWSNIITLSWFWLILVECYKVWSPLPSVFFTFFWAFTRSNLCRHLVKIWPTNFVNIFLFRVRFWLGFILAVSILLIKFIKLLSLALVKFFVFFITRMLVRPNFRYSVVVNYVVVWVF